MKPNRYHFDQSKPFKQQALGVDNSPRFGKGQPDESPKNRTISPTFCNGDQQAANEQTSKKKSTFELVALPLMHKTTPKLNKNTDLFCHSSQKPITNRDVGQIKFKDQQTDTRLKTPASAKSGAIRKEPSPVRNAL